MAITPYLYYEDVNAALKWLAMAFGFKPYGARNTGPDGKIDHAAMQYGDAIVMMGRPAPKLKYRNPRRLGQATQSLYVNVEDVDEHFQRAKRAGATILEVEGPELRKGLHARNLAKGAFTPRAMVHTIGGHVHSRPAPRLALLGRRIRAAVHRAAPGASRRLHAGGRLPGAVRRQPGRVSLAGAAGAGALRPARVAPQGQHARAGRAAFATDPAARDPAGPRERIHQQLHRVSRSPRGGRPGDRQPRRPRAPARRLRHPPPPRREVDFPPRRRGLRERGRRAPAVHRRGGQRGGADVRGQKRPRPPPLRCACRGSPAGPLARGTPAGGGSGEPLAGERTPDADRGHRARPRAEPGRPIRAGRRRSRAALPRTADRGPAPGRRRRVARHALRRAGDPRPTSSRRAPIRSPGSTSCSRWKPWAGRGARGSPRSAIAPSSRRWPPAPPGKASCRCWRCASTGGLWR